MLVHVAGVGGPAVLNEVLSLNAQEYADTESFFLASSILNEVLSLNAQEFGVVDVVHASQLSSMKS